MRHKWVPCWVSPEIEGIFCTDCEEVVVFEDDNKSISDCEGRTGVHRGNVFYKCLGCGRDKFTRMYQPHKCNGQYRKHNFPAGFKLSNWQP